MAPPPAIVGLRAGRVHGIALIALHSLVDYPARTAAIAVVAAMCIGMIARPGSAMDAEA